MRTRGWWWRSPWILAVLAAGPFVGMASGQSEEATAADARRITVTDAAGRVHSRMKPITQAEREAAAARLKAARAAARAADAKTGKAAAGARPAAAAATAMLTANQLVTGPNGELIPDYSGVTPNWANSPIIRKFVDGLPGLGPAAANNLGQYIPVATPDVNTYPGADYYEIELGQYTVKMHTDLPPTTVRGYRQTNMGGTPFQYLGPLIVAQKGRPVRITFTNNLPAGADGNLFIPVDATVMGAGPGPNVSDAARASTPADVLCRTTPAGAVPPGCFTQNRATIHLHGGVTPWISDGTTHQWITPAAENGEYPKGVSVYNVPDMPNPGKPPVAPSPDPGAGVQTFYYTNEQSARLMFYHDHAAGITRLNVYAGEAAGYLLQDPVEADLVARGIIPADQIPLIIQDKTFVDATTIAAQDPTWNWGTGAVDPLTGRRVPNTGDLWYPHVYMPAQNPYDLSGLNPMGRWHYGPWFWPPTNNIAYGPVPNPYYDCGAGGPCTMPWQPLEIPGTPNPSWGAEAFLDTPVINGTAYPTITVQPKAYRLRILDAADDRFFNLSFFVAADKNTQTTAVADPALPPSVLCTGAVPAADCTEVKMVPAAPGSAGFPDAWPTDGREGGVPDPSTKGPDWIQIGTEGGFLPAPVVIPAQPITWNLDPTTFNFGNVADHSLLLGPAERADVIVDFSAYAGRTLILYNDAPAAFPALDARNDYYTGAPDLRDTGGADTPQPGMGPNTRTILQIRVTAEGAAPFDRAALEAEFASAPGHPGVFERGQDPIVVGQAAYDGAYTRTTTPETFPSTYPYWGVARIQDNAMSIETVGGARVTLPLEPKAIQDEMGEAFDDYGRMAAKLGLETPAGIPGGRNFVLQGYADPPTELIRLSATATPIGTPALDGTQIWKITHNGVDTHPVHFHLFHVQLINRVGWDGAIRLPDANELGWKDTVRISPLEDTIVALRPIAPRPESLPFKVPNSFRPLEPALPIGSTRAFTHLDPQGNAVTVTNEITNFGWEYIWHCHILAHEENDMMRAIAFAATPEAPLGLSAALQTGGGLPAVNLSWTDFSSTASSFRIERSTALDFSANLATFHVPVPPCEVPSGCPRSYTDPDTPPGTQYYRVFAVNTVGSTVPGYPTLSAESLQSNIASSDVPMERAAVLSPASLTFQAQLVGTASTAQTVTLSNPGAALLTISGISLDGWDAGEYAQTNTCGATLAGGASCVISVVFAPLGSAGAKGADLVVATDDPNRPTQTVTLFGVSTSVRVSPPAVVFADQVVGTLSPISLVTLTNVGPTALDVGGSMISSGDVGSFVVSTTTCGAALAAGASCTIGVRFQPTAAGPTGSALQIHDSDPTSPQEVPLSGTGIAPEAGVTPGALSFSSPLSIASTPQTVTVTNTGLAPLRVTGVTRTGTNAGQFQQTNTCVGAPVAPGGSCAIQVTFLPTAASPLTKTAVLNVVVAAPAVNQTVSLTGTIVVPTWSASPASLAFGPQPINTSSAPQTVTITNTGITAPLRITRITLNGAATHYSQTNTCGPFPATLAPGGSCTAEVVFRPTTRGLKNAGLVVTVSAPGTSATVPLSGTGQ